MNKELQKDLEQWFEVSNQLQALKEKEMSLRKSIFKLAFPAPKEGTNILSLGDGYDLKGVHKINRKIDEAALHAGKDTFESENIVLDRLVRFKPELSTGEYKKLTDAQRHCFDFCLVATEGSPSIEIVKSKGK